MTRIIRATYEDGVLKPDEELALDSGTAVRLTLDVWAEVHAQAQEACADLDRLCEEFPIQSDSPHLARDELHDRR